MHILFIHQVFLAPHEAGSTRHFELARYLVRKGHKVTIIGSSVSYLTGKIDPKCKGKFLHKENIEGVDIIRTWTYSKVNKSYVTRFISFISFMLSSIIGAFKAGKTDMIVACSPQIFTGISGIVVSKIKKIPFVFEVRDLWPKFAVETKVLTNPKLIKLAEGLEKFIYKRADHFIINSPGFYTHLEGFNIPREKIMFVPNGVDTDIFQPGEKDNQFRREFNLGNKFVIMYAGAHGKANDLKTVIETARLLKNHLEILFLFVGDGKERPALEKLKNEYNLNNVLFAGAQPKSRMPEICRSADVCLAILEKHPAFKTVYPNKVFDYMASARPILLAIDGVIRDVVEKANAGFFVKQENPQALAESVLKCYNKKEQLSEYGNNGREYVVRNFERKKTAENFKQDLEKLLIKK